MALTYNAQGCRQASENLKTSANELDRLLNTDLPVVINKIKNNYQSETANELYAMFDKMKAKFPEFIGAINNCSKYLSETVAPAYDRVEKTGSSKING